MLFNIQKLVTDNCVDESVNEQVLAEIEKTGVNKRCSMLLSHVTICCT
jgi:hypothetical protein